MAFPLFGTSEPYRPRLDERGVPIKPMTHLDRGIKRATDFIGSALKNAGVMQGRPRRYMYRRPVSQQPARPATAAQRPVLPPPSGEYQGSGLGGVSARSTGLGGVSARSTAMAPLVGGVSARSTGLDGVSARSTAMAPLVGSVPGGETPVKPSGPSNYSAAPPSVPLPARLPAPTTPEMPMPAGFAGAEQNLGNEGAAAARFREVYDSRPERAAMQQRRQAVTNDLRSAVGGLERQAQAELYSPGVTASVPAWQGTPHWRPEGRVSQGEFRHSLPSDDAVRQSSFRSDLPDLNAEQDGFTRRMVDGQYIAAGPRARVFIDDGGEVREAVMPRSGTSLGLRTRGTDGSTRTESQFARTVKALNEQDPTGERAQKFMDYVDRRRERRDDALDLRRRANAMRGWGQTGAMNVVDRGTGRVWSQPVFGQTGPSLAQAAGMLNREGMMLDEAERLADKQFNQELRRDRLSQQNRADAEVRITEAKADAVNRLPPMTPGAEAEDQLRKAQAEKAVEGLEAGNPVVDEIVSWSNTGLYNVPGPDAPQPDKLDYIWQIAQDRTLSDDAKRQLIRSYGVMSYDKLKDWWHGSVYDPFFGNNYDPLEAYLQLFPDERPQQWWNFSGY